MNSSNNQFTFEEKARFCDIMMSQLENYFKLGGIGIYITKRQIQILGKQNAPNNDPNE